MIVCESEFDFPDHEDPSIALTEVDYYAWIPPTKGIPNHRLSLRKRLFNSAGQPLNQYEVYRKFVTTEVHGVADATLGGLMSIQIKANGAEQVMFSSPVLQEALDFANSEANKYHGYGSNDKACTHRYPNRSDICRVKL
jgi:hypothetical protein